MKPDADLVTIKVLVVIAFTWRSVVGSRDWSAEDAGDVQVHQSSESESE
jgi:hypothetical protein